MGTIVALGVTLSLLVRIPGTSENISILIVLAMVLIDGKLMVLFAFHGYAEVYEKSQQISKGMRSNVEALISPIRQKWTRLFLRSCGAIKMKFGGNSYVDRLTPLNCIGHAVQLTVQILLLGHP